MLAIKPPLVCRQNIDKQLTQPSLWYKSLLHGQARPVTILMRLLFGVKIKEGELVQVCVVNHWGMEPVPTVVKEGNKISYQNGNLGKISIGFIIS